MGPRPPRVSSEPHTRVLDLPVWHLDPRLGGGASSQHALLVPAPRLVTWTHVNFWWYVPNAHFLVVMVPSLALSFFLLAAGGIIHIGHAGRMREFRFYFFSRCVRNYSQEHVGMNGRIQIRTRRAGVEQARDTFQGEGRGRATHEKTHVHLFKDDYFFIFKVLVCVYII